jgi:HPt (histidine-containing phosphotransfer) domain-containing protein
MTPADEDSQKQEDYILRQKLKINFVKSNRSKFPEIIEAIAAGDITLAHRLAHTLKGNAGQIGKTGLQKAAAEIEELLINRTIPTAEQMQSLEAELNMVLEELSPLLDEALMLTGLENLNKEQVLVLFEKLEPMLEKINPECVNLLDEIRRLPGAEELTRQIEDYDFESAARTLAELRKSWVE